MKRSILVGDIGSTSGTWEYRDNATHLTFITEGFNPNSHNPSVLDKMVSSVADKCPSVDGVFYYGSGISNREISKVVHHVLTTSLGATICEVHSDLLGAARACCGHQDGVVAILGTGSNCCIFKDGRVASGLPSLGYPLGDEGGGWRIGSAMIKGYYYGLMPEALRLEFKELLPDSRSDLLSYLRQSPTPNRYLASFATFASAHIANAWVSESVSDQLKEFIDTHLKQIQPAVLVHFVGGIAAAFGPILKQLLKESGLTCGNILQDPIQALIEYHLNDE